MISRNVSIYAILHFLMDFCCAFFMYRLSGDVKEFYFCFLLYNFCAFALQMPVGVLADRGKKPHKMAAIGCLMTGTASLLHLWARGWYEISPCYMIFIILAGVGNCLFHVGGGMKTLQECKEKLTPLGVFVSPGAMGIYLGTLWGKGTQLQYGIPFALLLLGGLYLWKINREDEGEVWGEAVLVQEHFTKHKIRWSLVLACFFGVVLLRSHLGMIFSFPWKTMQTGAILGLLAVVFGKAAGGLLADRIGLEKVIIVSMLAAMVGFCFADNMFLGIFGLFCFNMSMPMTLYLAAKVLGEYKGFAFGFLTFAIFVGFLPAYFGYRQCTREGLVIMSFFSLLFLWAGFRIMQNEQWQRKDCR